jgi:hypothetical protein
MDAAPEEDLSGALAPAPEPAAAPAPPPPPKKVAPKQLPTPNELPVPSGGFVLTQ